MEIAFTTLIPLVGSRPLQVLCKRSVNDATYQRAAFRRHYIMSAARQARDQPGRRTRVRRPPLTTRQRNPSVSASQSEYDRALELSTRRNKRAAREVFRSATRAYPQDGRLWLAWAQMEERAGNMQAARSIFAEGVDANPENVRLLHAWAVAEDRASSPHAARRLFLRCLDASVADGLVWQGLALLEERCGDTDAARDTFRRGTLADESNASLWSAWGVLEHRHKSYEKAADLFERAIQLDSNHARTFQAYAITAEKLGDNSKSFSLFREALRIDPMSVPTHQAFGLFEARRGRYEAARQLFEKGLKLDRGHVAIWHAWAVMEQQLGLYEVARELFQKGLSAAPENTALLRAWARMELELGHIDSSQDWRVPRIGYKSKARPRARGSHSSKQISTVAENLMMLRLMIERKSDEDVKTVMKWLDGRANADRKLYDTLAERQSNDVRSVSEWVERRSASDIKSFKNWLDSRYEKDRRIGVYVFNWTIPPLSPNLVPPTTEKPVEWLRLEQDPVNSLRSFDEDVYCDDGVVDYAEGLYFVGRVAGGLVDRAALVFCLGAMSLFLIGASVHLHQLGYSPAGDQAVINETSSESPPPPSGVDAYLYEDGGAEKAVSSLRHQIFGKSPLRK